jgi:hypothetical protein
MMKNIADIPEEFGVAHELKVISAHRPPDLLFEFRKFAESQRSRSKQSITGNDIRFFKSFRCPPRFQLQHSPSARQAQRTPRFSPFRLSLICSPNLEKKLHEFKAKQNQMGQFLFNSQIN